MFFLGLEFQGWGRVVGGLRAFKGSGFGGWRALGFEV